MKTEVRFTKMHGIGNDYIYFTELPCEPEELPALSIRLSDRHRGIGGDGIILALPSDVADFRMRIFNADGSEAAMCGNGSRCVGKLVYDSGLADKTDLTLETIAGIKTLHLHPDPASGRISTVTVEMGRGIASDPLTLQSSQGPVRVIPVNMGNPHAVIFIDRDPDEADVHTIGRELEHHPIWPDRANIEFAQVIAPGEIKMRVWERGSGETMACGTGACATAVAAAAAGMCGPRTLIHLPGGDLHIELSPTGDVSMTGPAETVFEGYIRI